MTFSLTLPLLALILLPFLHRLSAQSLGLDPNAPITFQHSLPGNERSHFGWSLTLVETAESTRKDYWIFIGDPRGNSTDPTYGNVKEPGVIWRCSISGTPNCVTLNLDPIAATCTRNDRETFQGQCQGVKPTYEYHDYNWVGGTLASTGNRLVTCAHRWHRGPLTPPQSLYPVMNGLCYWFDKDSMYRSWSPTEQGKDRLTILDTKPYYGIHRLIPFYFIGRDPSEDPWQYFDSSSGKNPDLAFAEAGISIHLTPLDSAGHNELLIGATGSRLFAGSVVRYHDRGIASDGYLRPQVPALSREEFSKFMNVRLPGDHYNAYFGYAVTSGQYLNKGETYYVGGAPRDQKLTGLVTLFVYPRSVSGQSSDIPEIIINLPTPAPQFGSYFGSVLSSGDVNGNELDELFVAAPFYNTVPGSVLGNEGAVFVFHKAMPNSNHLQQFRITGSNLGGSRFGSAMVVIGDLNEDGYNEIAIGAPFEGGQGAVYIFYGKSDIYEKWTYGLRLSPDDYVTPIPWKGFGCTFSTSLDIDGNGTPDLAIGSFLSKSVSIFRTRPSLGLTSTLLFYDTTGTQLIKVVPSNVRTFRVYSCVQLVGRNLRGQLEIETTLSIDARLNRFRFSSDQNLLGSGRSLVTFKSTANPSNVTCRLFQAEVIKEERELGAGAVIEPITFDQFVEYKGNPIQDPPAQIFQLLGNERVKGNGVSDQFCSSCPFPVNKSKSEVLPIATDCADVNHCMPDLGLWAWFTGKSGNVTLVELDWTSRYSLWIKVWNRAEPAFSPEVFVDFNTEQEKPPSFDLSSLGCESVVGGNKDKFTCSLGRPIKRNEHTFLELPFTLRDVYAQRPSRVFQVRVNAGNKNDDLKSRPVFDLTLELIAKASVKLIGSGTSLAEAVHGGSIFQQDYEVILEGTSPVADLNFAFDFPVYRQGPSQSKKPVEVILLENPPTTVITCTSTYKFFDFSKQQDPVTTPLEIPSTTTGMDNMEVTGSRRRRRREVQPRLPQITRLTPNENMTLFSCEGSVACIRVSCKFHNRHPNVEIPLISFRMKLVKEEAIEVRKEKSFLLVDTRGTVTTLFGIVPADHTSSAFSQTLIRLDDTIQRAEGAPLWIYIVSGIGGIILLVLIMICLYKAGFFKRSTKQQLQEMKAQVEIQENLQTAARRASAMSAAAAGALAAASESQQPY